MYGKNQLKKLDAMIRTVIAMAGCYKFYELDYILKNVLDKYPGISYVIDEDDYYDLGHLVVTEGVEIVDDDENYFLEKYPEFVYSNDAEYVKMRSGRAIYR